MKKSHVFFGGIVVLGFLLGTFYIPALTRYHNLKLQEEEMDIKIRELDQKIKSLVEERDLLKNDRDYLEKVIRKELGLVKPGEIIYKFITEPAKKPRSASVKEDIEAVKEGVAPVQGTKPAADPTPAVSASAKVTESSSAPVHSAPKIKIVQKVENDSSKTVTRRSN